MRSKALKLAAAAACVALTIAADAQEISTDRVFSPIQLSFIPTFGTNGFVSGKIENGVSINLIAGVSKGVRWVEVGGVANIVKADAGVAQLAGVVNLTGGNVKGAQLAGVANFSGNVKGVQLAGVVNLAKGNIRGAQLSGVCNMGDSVKGVQLAGVSNLTKAASGVQLAGVVNKTGRAEGYQLAGVANVANVVKGVQVAGILNRAKVVKGVQLGLINISDSCSGVPIGLVIIVRSGYIQFEAGSDETGLVSIAYRSGVKKLHTTVGASILPDMSRTVKWGTTFGLGTSYTLSQRTLLDADLYYTQLVCNDKFSHDNKLFRAYLGVDRHLFGRLSLAAGITANVLIYSTNSNDNIDSMKQLVPYTIISKKINSRNHLDGWIGGKIALRIN